MAQQHVSGSVNFLDIATSRGSGVSLTDVISRDQDQHTVPGIRDHVLSHRTYRRASVEDDLGENSTADLAMRHVDSLALARPRLNRCSRRRRPSHVRSHVVYAIADARHRVHGVVEMAGSALHTTSW
jgi:hypothetical protein